MATSSRAYELLDVFLVPAAVNASVITSMSGFFAAAALVRRAGRADVFEELASSECRAGSRLSYGARADALWLPRRLRLLRVNDVRSDPPMAPLPVPSRAACSLLFLASVIWTALVAADAIGVVWLVVGPVLTGWAWLIWAMLRQRTRVD